MCAGTAGKGGDGVFSSCPPACQQHGEMPKDKRKTWEATVSLTVSTKTNRSLWLEKPGLTNEHTLLPSHPTKCFCNNCVIRVYKNNS